jgi:hypothetical protein
MAKRKRDDTIDTKGVDADKEDATQPTVKKLSLHPLWSLRKDVLGNPNLLRTAASFLELKDQIALGKSHKSANRNLLKGDRGKKLKETATCCCLCKKIRYRRPDQKELLAQTFVREVEEFKSSYYCYDCTPTQCVTCTRHFKYNDTFVTEKDMKLYCEGCYDDLDRDSADEEEEEAEKIECEECGCMFAEEDLDEDNLCDECNPIEMVKCCLCNARYGEGKGGSHGFCDLCVPNLRHL